MKDGDRLIFKNVNQLVTNFTPGKSYEITLAFDKEYFTCNNDNDELWGFEINQPSQPYYYGNFFYTKSEMRNIIISDLGI